MHNSTRIESGPFAHSFTDTTRCASPLLLLLCSRRSVANAEDLPVFLHHHHQHHRRHNIPRQSAASPIRTNPHTHTHTTRFGTTSVVSRRSHKIHSSSALPHLLSCLSINLHFNKPSIFLPSRNTHTPIFRIPPQERSGRFRKSVYCACV